MEQTINRKGTTFQIDKETEDDYICYITKIGDIEDQDFLNMWIEYNNRDQTEEYIEAIKDGYYDYIINIIKDIYRLKEKYKDIEEFGYIVHTLIDPIS